MKQLRGFRFRFYPTPAQKLELAQTFGCGRFIYNWALSLKIAQYEELKQNLSYQDLSKELTQLKKDPEKPWLNLRKKLIVNQPPTPTMLSNGEMALLMRVHG